MVRLPRLALAAILVLSFLAREGWARGVDTSGIERAGLNINLLVDVQDVGGSSAERAPRGSDLFLRDDHLLHAELVGKHTRMRRARTAECEEHEVPRIEPLFDGHLAN